jgi:antitoxin (DNA-binding transcriptional repressor) of toxin-antitoxin stability system
VITVTGRPVARLGPLPATERRPMPRGELRYRLDGFLRQPVLAGARRHRPARAEGR